MTFRGYPSVKAALMFLHLEKNLPKNVYFIINIMYVLILCKNLKKIEKQMEAVTKKNILMDKDMKINVAKFYNKIFFSFSFFLQKYC